MKQLLQKYIKAYTKKANEIWNLPFITPVLYDKAVIYEKQIIRLKSLINGRKII